MLEKVIMLPFNIFMIFLFAFFAVTGMAMFSQWSIVQNEAQFVASSMGKWGGYTQQAADSVNDFARDLNLSRSQVEVDVSEVGPIPFGKPITVTVTIPFKFKVGEYNVGTFDLTGKGRAVSSCIDAYAVNYIYP